MTPSEALALLDSLVKQLQLNRDEHGRVWTAVQTLGALVKPQEAPSNG
jgi:hypothetical protein